VVTLLGDRAWWLPRPLDRLLPNVSLEGHLVQGLNEGLNEKAEAEREKVSA
jgi:RND superfamily putative drug exporter